MDQSLLHNSQTNSALSGKGEGLTTIKNLLNFRNHNFITLEQVHGDQWQEIKQSHNKPVPNLDAAVTTKPNLALTIHTADCIPLIFYHPRPPLVGVIHAGRKGLEKQIVQKVFSEVTTQFKLSLDKFYIWMGPHICEKCYQIDRQKNLHYNLKNEVLAQLKKALGKNYELTQDCRCTSCHNDELYSYRCDGNTQYLNYTAIALN